MSPLIGALIGAGLAASIILLINGLQRHPPRRPRAQVPLMTRWANVTRRPSGIEGRRRDLKLVGVAVATALTFLITRWPITLALVPLALLLVPWLLANNNKSSIDKLAALETWVRALRALLQGGSENTLEAALQSTLTSTPAAIKPEVSALVARLNARWPADRALARFADDLNDSTGDVIAAALMLAARRRGGGLTAILDGLSESVSDEVRARRKIEGDRAIPRLAASFLTALFAGLAVFLAITNPEFLAPYGTPTGTLILLGIVTAYLGSLFLIRRITMVRDKPRIHPIPRESWL